MATIPTYSKRTTWIIRILGVFVVAGFIASAGLITYFLNDATSIFITVSEQNKTVGPKADPFPVGVDPVEKTITEQANVETYLEQYFVSDFKRTQKRITWLDKLYEKVAYLPLYQSLASPNARILVIFAGQRKEQIASNFSKLLGWSAKEKNEFLILVTSSPLALADGTFYPGRYVTTVDASPKEVAHQLQTAFTENVLDRYPDELIDSLPLEDTLIIASLIEREANAFSDMREISGVIWNRLFIDMKLQLDASLQYARGSRSWEPDWWPVPVPRDKYIDSPFNTYQVTGLPPNPIANPSAAAILAALNPTQTDCLFYFHDYNGDMHCSATYEEHKEKIKISF